MSSLADTLVANVHEIAKARYTDPMSTWPDHIGNHKATVPMGYLLPDGACLRCALESEAARDAREKNAVQVT
jgi:hypothetical protein